MIDNNIDNQIAEKSTNNGFISPQNELADEPSFNVTNRYLYMNHIFDAVLKFYFKIRNRWINYAE